MDINEIKVDINIGAEIFNTIPNDVRPLWAGLILSCFKNYITNIPAVIAELDLIIENPDRWKDGHHQFVKIRQFLLPNKEFQPQSFLLLGENVAKVVYNASGGLAPFDADSSWWIPRCALETAEYFNDERLEDEVKSAILLFYSNAKFKDNLNAAKDFLLYKRIDNILWFDWDPIGIRKHGPRDEYQSYIAGIFRLRKLNSNREEIAKLLYKFETERMGMGGNIENCLVVADKIIRAH